MIAVPFSNLGVPTTKPSYAAAGASAPYPTATPKPPPPRQTRGSLSSPLSTATNKYVGWCWCCGIEGRYRRWFSSSNHCLDHAKYECVCATASNTRATVYSQPAQRQRPAKGKKSISDLA